MSSERTAEDAWATQLAYHEARGTKPPDTLDPADEVTLREILGDDASVPGPLSAFAAPRARGHELPPDPTGARTAGDE